MLTRKTSGTFECTTTVPQYTTLEVLDTRFATIQADLRQADDLARMITQ